MIEEINLIDQNKVLIRTPKDGRLSHTDLDSHRCSSQELNDSFAETSAEETTSRGGSGGSKDRPALSKPRPIRTTISPGSGEDRSHNNGPTPRSRLSIDSPSPNEIYTNYSKATSPQYKRRPAFGRQDSSMEMMSIYGGGGNQGAAKGPMRQRA